MTVATTTDIGCPNCGKQGRSTHAAHVAGKLLKDEFAGQIADANYRFCDAKDCNIVYFDNGQTFSKSQRKVAVGVKETQGERALCYCFGHSVATLKEEIRTKGQFRCFARHSQKDERPRLRARSRTHPALAASARSLRELKPPSLNCWAHADEWQG